MARATTASVEPQQDPVPRAFARPEPADPEPSLPAAVTHHDISRRAYDIYLAHGARDDFDREDWLEAERVLTIEAAAAKGRE
jgi:hypothetical protein